MKKDGLRVGVRFARGVAKEIRSGRGGNAFVRVLRQSREFRLSRGIKRPEMSGVRKDLYHLNVDKPLARRLRKDKALGKRLRAKGMR